MAYCKTVRLPDGGVAIVRFSGKQPQHKCACGRPATIQCDYPEGDGTCDKWLCKSCAVHVGRDRDYCPSHQLELLER